MNSNEGRRLGRPAISCALCRKRKLKCDRASPCSNCLRSRSRTPTIDCIYEDHDSPSSTSPEHPPKRHAQPPPLIQQQQPTPAEFTPHTSSSTLASRSVPLSDQDQPPRRSVTPAFIQFHTLASPLGSPEAPKALQASDSVKAHCLIEHNFFGETYKLEWGIAHKSRVFGQSHWLGIVEYFQDLVHLTTPYLQNKTAKAILSLRKCKDLAREIKSQRTPPWPTPPTDTLPPKPLSDSLVHAYLQTTETLYRVFHIPSFKRDYETLWLTTPSTPPANKAFLVQLKLVLAIGATTYDPIFSLRPSAVTWVYEAQTYLSEPHCKSRLGLQYLQTNILLMIAREATGIDSDSVWISAGSLIRLAMNMGLHRDPASLLVGRQVSRIVCEMRRRLWNTILELGLQSSFDSGKPALISLEDFDTECPGDFDDEQLMEESLSFAKGRGEVTGMSVAIALRRTLGVRLEIARVLNNQGVRGGYEKTLRLDGELRGLYRGIVRELRVGRGGDTERFDVYALEVIVHRYLASLHVPFLGCSDERGMGIASGYSRKAAVESALRIHAAGAGWPDRGGERSVFSRYTQCSSGFFPYAVFQADLIVTVELKSQLGEEASLGPAMLRQDLVDLLQDSKGFSLRCIEAGETNVKAYLFRCMVVAQIEGIRRGLEESELMEAVVSEAEEAVGVCVPMLEGMVGGRGRSEGGDDGVGSGGDDGSKEMTEDGTEDWDFLISGGLFHTGGGMDLMNWMVADDGGHGMVADDGGHGMVL